MPVGPPGQQWRYSNIGYLLLGRVITCRTAQRYNDWLQKELFTHLGIVHSGECDDMAGHPSTATPYAIQSGGHIIGAESVNMATVGASGAVCSTVLDLVALDSALAEGKLLAMSAMAELETPGCLHDGTTVDYGLGVFVGRLGGYREMLHRGDIPGGAAFKAYYPDVKLSVVILSNTLGAPVATIGRRVARTALSIPAPTPAAHLISAEERRRVAGIYCQQRLNVHVSIQDTQVIASTPDGQVTLLAQGENSFVSATDPDMRFTFAFTPASSRLHVTGPGFRFNGIRHP